MKAGIISNLNVWHRLSVGRFVGSLFVGWLVRLFVYVLVCMPFLKGTVNSRFVALA